MQGKTGMLEREMEEKGTKKRLTIDFLSEII